MLDHYLSIVSTYLQAHPHMGELFAFLVAFAESLPIIGTIIPGSITMTLIGILVGRGLLPVTFTLLWATVGALLGDGIGFWLGRYYDKRITAIWPFRKYPKLLAMGERFFEKHGGKSIIIGRFIGPARSTVPLIAGLLKVSWPRFILAAVPSAFLWSLTYLVPGILIGAISLQLPPKVTARFMLIGLAVIVLLWLVYWAVQRFFVYLSKQCNKLIDKAWQKLNKQQASHKVLQWMINRKNPSDHHQLTLAILGIFSLVIFFIVFISVYCNTDITYLNQPIHNLLQSLRAPHLDYILIIMTQLGERTTIIPVALLTAAGLFIMRERRTALYIFLILVTTMISILALKFVFYSPRPGDLMIVATTSSFPSGSATLCITILGFTAYLTAQRLEKNWHWIPYLATGIITTLIIASRIYLGSQWLTDTFGSLALSFAILLLYIMSYRRHPEATSASLKSWLWILGVGILLPWGANIALFYRESLNQYTTDWPGKTISYNSWWEYPAHHVPIYRLNRFGTPVQPLNIQWAAPLSNIRATLHKNQWEILSYPGKDQTNNPEKLKLKHPIHLLPLLFHNRPPVLIAIKKVTEPYSLVVIRLWYSDIKFKGNNSPLWIGTTNYRQISTSIIQLENIINNALLNGAGITELSADLNGYQWQFVQFPKSALAPIPKSLGWDGRILVAKQFIQNDSLHNYFNLD
jgi:membrane protein DedA with SNARE-associated domain